MDITCSEEELAIFRKIADAGSQINTPVYIIGGFVRDKILNRPTKDADIVCLGDGIALAKKTAQYFNPEPQVSVFKNFGTAQIKIYPTHLFNKTVASSPEKGWAEVSNKLVPARSIGRGWGEVLKKINIWGKLLE